MSQCFCACTNVFIPASVFTRHFAPSCGSHWYYTKVQPSFSSASADISLTKDTNVLDIKSCCLGFFIFCSLLVAFKIPKKCFYIYFVRLKLNYSVNVTVAAVIRHQASKSTGPQLSLKHENPPRRFFSPQIAPRLNHTGCFPSH